MIRIILTIMLATSVSACDFLDRMEGRKSEAQIQHEAAAEAGLPPPINVWSDPAPLFSEPEPVQTCFETFRINRCHGNVSVEWYYIE